MAPTVRVRIAKALTVSIRSLTRQINQLEHELDRLVAAHSPGLVAEVGIGTLTAATLIGHTAGAGRFATDAHFARLAGTAPIPASSGQTVRHRLDRGGDRQLNYALHVIALTRIRLDPASRAYVERRKAEGKTSREAMRCLKRYIARMVWKHLRATQAAHDRPHRPNRPTAAGYAVTSMQIPCIS
jgi:transposase